MTVSFAPRGSCVNGWRTTALLVAQSPYRLGDHLIGDLKKCTEYYKRTGSKQEALLR
jgi:hypothetical protein